MNPKNSLSVSKFRTVYFFRAKVTLPPSAPVGSATDKNHNIANRCH